MGRACGTGKYAAIGISWSHMHSILRAGALGGQAIQATAPPSLVTEAGDGRAASRWAKADVQAEQSPK